jgi:uncharacterized membrane protein
MMGSGYMWNGGAGGFPMFIMPIMMIIVVLVVVYFLFGRGSCSYHSGQQDLSSSIPPRGESALEIAEKRYARGEINKEDFGDLKKNLEG